MKAKFSPPPDNSFVMFAGTADIDEANLSELLYHFLPEGIIAKIVIEQRPRTTPGLGKVVAYFRDIWPEDEDNAEPGFTRERNLLKGIDELEHPEDAYLVVLWDGNDEKTEQLVDAAIRRGVTVLDLTDGLEPIEGFDDKKPGQQQAETPAASETPPWEAASTTAENDTSHAEIAEMLAAAFDAAAQALRAYGKRQQRLATVAVLHTAENHEQPDSPAADSEEQAAPKRRRRSAPSGTRAWRRDPENPDHYELQGRGRPRSDIRDWEEVFLTPDEEKRLGLKVPAR